MARTLLEADAAVIDGVLVESAEVLVDSGRVLACGRGPLGTAGHDGVRKISGTLLPGPIDLQVNGAGGHGVDEVTPEALDAIAAAVLEGGATGFLPTLITASMDVLVAQTAALAAWIGDRAGGGATPLGIHLEGPFLEVPGAHDPGHFVDPTAQRLDALLEAAQGRLALVTLAPDRPGAVEATRRLVEAGVCVAIGHASGTQRFAACVEAGARLVTHLFNAMEPMHHREPGVAGLALDEQRLCCSMILDGAHVHPVMVRNAWRSLGASRLVLVTDSVSAAGMPDGDYALGGASVRRTGGVVRDAEGRLAGSALTERDAVRGLMACLPWIGPEELARVTAANPARLIGDGERGSISRDRRAELAVLDPQGNLRALRLV